MIQSIQLINFQGHKNTTIDLSKGLNSLSGEKRLWKNIYNSCYQMGIDQ